MGFLDSRNLFLRKFCPSKIWRYTVLQTELDNSPLFMVWTSHFLFLCHPDLAATLKYTAFAMSSLAKSKFASLLTLLDWQTEKKAHHPKQVVYKPWQGVTTKPGIWTGLDYGWLWIHSLTAKNNYRSYRALYCANTDESTAVQPMFHLHNMWIVFCYM